MMFRSWASDISSKSSTPPSAMKMSLAMRTGSNDGASGLCMLHLSQVGIDHGGVAGDVGHEEFVCPFDIQFLDDIRKGKRFVPEQITVVVGGVIECRVECDDEILVIHCPAFRSRAINMTHTI